MARLSRSLKTATLGALSAAALYWPLAAEACRCRLPTAAALYESHPHLVIAQAVRTRADGPERQGRQLSDVQIVDVIRWDSGSPPTQFRTRSHKVDSCGTTLEPGETYLLVPGAPDLDFVHACSSWPLSPDSPQLWRLGEDLKAIAAAKRSTKPSTDRPAARSRAASAAAASD